MNLPVQPLDYEVREPEPDSVDAAAWCIIGMLLLILAGTIWAVIG